jgi:hypothetical protein
MNDSALLLERLQGQRLIGLREDSPQRVVRSMAAIQAQDYAAAKWALALRSPGVTEREIEILLSEGRLLRTHVLRPTWHFVAPEDIRWMLRLTAKRVHAINAPYYRKNELTEAVFRKSGSILERELGRAGFLSRERIAGLLRGKGIPAEGMRLALLLMKAELDGLICSGPREGTRFTYALLEERAGSAPDMTKDEALAELAKRYFSTRGPATLKDFSWWSGLSAADAGLGVELTGGDLVREKAGDLIYWDGPSGGPRRAAKPSLLLLPNYDEFVVSYADRRAIRGDARGYSAPESILFRNIAVVDGIVRGTWKLRKKAKSAVLEYDIQSPLSDGEERELRDIGLRLARFLEMGEITMERPKGKEGENEEINHRGIY